MFALRYFDVYVFLGCHLGESYSLTVWLSTHQTILSPFERRSYATKVSAICFPY